MITLTDYLDTDNSYIKQTISTVFCIWIYIDCSSIFAELEKMTFTQRTALLLYDRTVKRRGWEEGVKGCEWLSADIDGRTLGRQPGRVSIEIQSTNPQRSTNISLERVDLNLLTVLRRLRSPRSIWNMEKYEVLT